MKIYLSSTYTDLKSHRAKLSNALRKSGYEVVMMEEYAARDLPVPLACERDVGACDLYVGVFAWRYGYVPDDDNPQHLSVTEMEYAAAGAKPMTRLTFLLDEKARWPAARKDPDPARINDLRTRLRKQASGYFTSADELASEVQAALRIEESTRLASQLEAMDVMLKSQELGPSYMMNLKEQFAVLREVQFIEVQIGGAPWWNTRLYLVAALARDVGRARGLVFVDGAGKFLLMASPSEICHRFATRWPALDRAYTSFRAAYPAVETLADGFWTFPGFVNQALGADEQVARHVLSAHDLDYELGIARNADVVDVAGKGQRFLQREILGRQSPFVALVRDGRLEGLVDRQLLADRVAQAALL